MKAPFNRQLLEARTGENVWQLNNMPTQKKTGWLWHSIFSNLICIRKVLRVPTGHMHLFRAQTKSALLWPFPLHEDHCQMHCAQRSENGLRSQTVYLTILALQYPVLDRGSQSCYISVATLASEWQGSIFPGKEPHSQKHALRMLSLHLASEAAKWLSHDCCKVTAS